MKNVMAGSKCLYCDGPSRLGRDDYTEEVTITPEGRRALEEYHVSKSARLARIKEAFASEPARSGAAGPREPRDLAREAEANRLLDRANRALFSGDSPGAAAAMTELRALFGEHTS